MVSFMINKKVRMILSLLAFLTFTFGIDTFAQSSMADKQRAAISELRSAVPGLQVRLVNKQVSQVYGKSFSSGNSAIESADNFRQRFAHLFGVEAAELLPGGPIFDGRDIQPVMYDRRTGNYKFTLVYYTQHREGIPVFRSDLRLLIRNNSDNQLVLANSTVKNLEDFTVNPIDKNADLSSIVNSFIDPNFPAPTKLSAPKRVIWAGFGDEDNVIPRVAAEFTASNNDRLGPQAWLYVVDVETGEILYRENQIHQLDVTGNVSGLATELAGADTCESESSVVMPYARVNIGDSIAFADSAGDYTIPNLDTTDVTVESRIWGKWFRVYNSAGSEELLSKVVTPPGPADFTHNSSNNDEFVRAQVNAYVEANRIRDLVLTHNPSFPGTDLEEMTINVNINSSPPNASYNHVALSLNFDRADNSIDEPNTAFSSVIHHEYGHHLVQMAGSLQGQYGEGMGDCMGILTTDKSIFALGKFGNCSSGWRDADNTKQYPQTGPIHDAGTLISGCVWSLRDTLAQSEPSDYRDILADLTVNSILLHNTHNINPQITIDFLTLDDDDADLSNGTPHYDEINWGFGEHNMGVASYDVVWVDSADGDDATGDGSELNPYSTIGKAMTSIADWGDSIKVGPGTYSEEIDFDNKEFVLISTDGPVATTVKASLSDDILVQFGNVQTQFSVLEGFTLEGGLIGVLSNGSSPVVRKNVIFGQSGTGATGIKVISGDNHGLYSINIHNNTIRDVGGYGIHNQTLTLGVGDPTSDIRNNIVMNCDTGIYQVDDFPGFIALPTLEYNDVWGNDVDYVRLTAGTGSISQDPKLASDSASLLGTSPCINAGDPDDSFDDPNGSRNDIGAIPFGGNITINVPSEESTIQAGIDAAVDGDTVLVAPGTYIENINFIGKDVLVTSSLGADSTKIQANDVDSAVVYLVSHETRAAVLDGFTITGSNFGGVFCDSASPTIINNIIEKNKSNSINNGAGLDLNHTNGALIKGNIFRNDSASVYGAAIHMEHCVDDTISYNLIYNCYGYMEIRCLSTKALIHNNTIDGDGSRAHGISNQSGSDTIDCRNNIILNVKFDGIYAANSGFAKTSNNLIWNFGRDSLGGAGIVSNDDNVFADPLLTVDWRPYRLSPAIDAGDTSSAFFDPDSTTNDIGVYPVYQVGGSLKFTSIQSAMDTVSDGDVVLVNPGKYTENIDFKGKRIIVTSSDSDSYAGDTIYASNPNLPTVNFDNEPKGAEISHFTITGSNASGIRADSTSASILFNLIERNKSNSGNDGAGLDMNYTNGALVKGNIFRYDTASTYGSAIHTEHCVDDTISYNLIYDCYGFMEIRCLSSNTLIHNNTIDGAGSRAHCISNQNGSDTIDCRNNIVINAKLDGIYAASSGYAIVAFNDSYGNTRDSLGGSGIIDDGGNIYSDPLLDANYLLDSLSLCIDAGDSADFYDDPDGSRNDMGWQPFGTIFVLPRYVVGAFALEDMELPLSYELSQNYPNPFNPSTTIKFFLPTQTHVRLEVFNILGQRVTTLVDGDLPAGQHQVEWDGRNEQGRPVSSGVYFYRVVTDEFYKSKKMMLIK